MLSVLRIVAALLFLQYGLSKYFGYLAKPPANFSMLSLLGLAGAIELVGSLLLLVGLWSRWAAFIMSGEIAVAYFMRGAPNGFFLQVNGGGLEVLFCSSFCFCSSQGRGRGAPMQRAGLRGCRCESRLLQLDCNREAAAPFTIDADECLRRFANASAGENVMETVGVDFT
jgi:putative oxidoreductase